MKFLYSWIFQFLYEVQSMRDFVRDSSLIIKMDLITWKWNYNFSFSLALKYLILIIKLLYISIQERTRNQFIINKIHFKYEAMFSFIKLNLTNYVYFTISYLTLASKASISFATKETRRYFSQLAEVA